MADVSNRNRVPKGVLAGGEFAKEQQARVAGLTLDNDNDVAGIGVDGIDVDGIGPDGLDDLDGLGIDGIDVDGIGNAGIDGIDVSPAENTNWGSATVSEGSRTPWGKADYVHHVAPGIAQASTPGHGGVKLSRERNAAIPAALRNASGWYEEDCEVHIVAAYHPEAFPTYLGGDLDAIRADAVRGIKDWFPDGYEKATGETIPLEQSYVKRDQAKAADVVAFRAEHAGQFVTTSRGDDDHGDWVPAGYKPMTARMDSTGETREFLVPEAECLSNGSFVSNRLIDPNRHLDVTGIGKLGNPASWTKTDGPKITGEDLGINYEGMTTAQRNRAADELLKRFRFSNEDGTQTVETYGEHLARVGVVGKRQMDDGYYVEYGDNSVSEINQATFAALTGVPDTATDEQRNGIAIRKAHDSLDRARAKANATYRPTDRAAAAKRVDAAHKAYSALRAHQDAVIAARKATETTPEQRQQMRTEALRQRLAEKGIEL